MPVVLLCAAKDSEVLLQGLIGSFARSVGLRVICYAHVLFDMKKLAEFRSKLRCEAHIAVRYDFVGYAVVRGYVIQVQKRNSF